MATVTRLRLRSGDRAALDGVVEDIRGVARRKGAEFKGPHSDAPEEFRAPMYKRLDGDPTAEYPSWEYTVYSRRIEIVGHDDLAAGVLDRGFPDSVHAEVELDRIRGVGRK